MASTQAVSSEGSDPGGARRNRFSDDAPRLRSDTPRLRSILPRDGADAPATGRRAERNIELCECMIDVAAALFNVSSKELRRPGRTSLAVARVRQVAMYVAHVVLGLSMNEVGRGFGRDRTTVLHACHLVEDMRDDIDFDRIVAVTERVADAALRHRGER